MLRSVTQRRRAIVTGLIAVAGVILLVIATLNLKDYYTITHTGTDHPSSMETVTETTTVSERPVVVNDVDYSVPADQPRVIQIPALNVNGYIQRVGVDRDGSMSTPNNVFFAGWYAKSPAPGHDGLSIINGHAGGRYAQALFNHLGDLKENDTIRIQMGDLSWREFSVVSVKTYSLETAAEPLFAKSSDSERELHLITCDGVFNDTSKTFDNRIIVVAKSI